MRTNNEIGYVIDSDDVEGVKDRLLGRLTSKFSWGVVAFWIFVNSTMFEKGSQAMYFGSLYNQHDLVSVYYFIIGWPCIVFVGIFHYMILPGLNLAYRDLCLKTPLKRDMLNFDWVEPFKGFKSLITILMFATVLYAVFPPNVWATLSKPETAAHWFIFRIPYIGPAIVLLSAILLPHLHFNRLFSKLKKDRLRKLQEKLSQTPERRMGDVVRRMYLLLQKGEVEKMKTWLVDVKMLGEILIVALMHVILIEALTTIIHG